MISMPDIALLKNNFDHMKSELWEVKSDVKEIKETLNKFVLKVETEFLTKDHAEKTFASKLSQKIIYWFVWLISTWFIISVIAIVFKT